MLADRPLEVMILAQCYAPEDVSGAAIVTELATDLARAGHRVTVVTGAPSYPQGRVFPGYRNRIFQEETLEGVRVVRTWSFIDPRKTFWRRLLHYGTYSATAFYGGLLAGRPDVVLCFTPPLPLGASASALCAIWGVPLVLQLEDLYPDAAIHAGILRNRLAIRVLHALEREIYRRSDRISLITEGFRRALEEKGVPPGKLTMIPVWADPDQVRPMPRGNAFRLRNGLGSAFVVLYAGNLGLTSCLEDLLEAATLLRDEPGIRFVLVGEGVRKEALQALARERGLSAVTFLPFQPREQLGEMMAAADVGVVTLNAEASGTSMPSKVFTVMASARPVLAVAPPGSELARVVVDARCGTVVPPGDPGAVAAALVALRADEAGRDEMGRLGRAELEQRFSRRSCVERLERMLAETCGRATIRTPGVAAPA